MISTAAGSTAHGRKAGITALLLAASLLPLGGCVANGPDPVGVATLGDPVDKTVAATGVDENGAKVALQVPLPEGKPAVAVASAEEADVETGSAATVAALVPTGRTSGTISGSAAIDQMIEAAAAENGVPRELAFAVVHVESRYNPKAKGAGVYGLSQIMPSTARSLGFSGPVEALYDPATNLRYGMKYLKGAWEKGGRDICQAAMKYKGGHRATKMTRSASAYCSNVKRHIASITGQPAAEAVQVASLPQAVREAAAKPMPATAATAMAPVPTLPGVSAVKAIAETTAAPKAPVVEEAADPVVTAAAVEASGGKSGRPVAVAAVLSAEASVDAAAPDPSRFGD